MHFARVGYTVSKLMEIGRTLIGRKQVIPGTINEFNLYTGSLLSFGFDFFNTVTCYLCNRIYAGIEALLDKVQVILNA